MGAYSDGRHGAKGERYMLSKECLDLILEMFNDLIYTRDYSDTQIHHFLARGGPEALFGFGLDRADLVTVIRVLMDQIKEKDEILDDVLGYVGRALITPAVGDPGPDQILQLLAHAKMLQVPKPEYIGGR